LEFKRFKRTLRQVLLLPIVACLLLACVLVWQISGANATVGLIEESDSRIDLTTRIEGLVVDEETGLRGYQVTSDPRFLAPYRDAEAPIQQAIDKLQSMARPEQKDDLNQFLAEHRIWRQAFAEPLIATIAAGGALSIQLIPNAGATPVARPVMAAVSAFVPRFLESRS